MADETFPLRYKFKRKTTAQWASLNPVLLPGEPGIEVLSDNSEKIKYGDGVKTWSQLGYAAGGGGGGTAWLQGAGVPANNLGKAGDFYLRTSNGDVYGPKTDVWGAVSANLASTVTIGTVTTGAAGSPAMVSNSGTAMDPILDFVLPRADPATLSSAAPQALGTTAAPGTSTDGSRADHVHPRPTAGQVGADPTGTAAAAVAAHEAAADPHPGYLTVAEGDAAYATAAQGAKADTAVQPAALATKADLVNGLVPSSQLPGFVDDVIEGANLAAFPATGESGKLYVALDTGKTYRWSGSAYVEISASPGSTDAVPEGANNLYHTSQRAAAAAPVQSVAGKTGTVTLAKGDVGLGDVDNTSDANKPISNATQTALDGKVGTSDARLSAFTSSQTGLVPASGGGTSNFLRADGTFAAPPGGAGTPGGSDTQIQFNDGGTFGGDVDLTYNKTTNLLTSKGDILLDDGGSFTTTLQTVTATANRTISFPDATGTVALVGGSSGQVLVNTNGAVAGLSTLTADGSGNLTLSARLINAFNSLASAPAKLFSGTWFTGGTSTTTKPHVLIEPAGTTSTSWSTAGTGFGVNAPAGFTGRVVDFQVNGNVLFNVDNTTGASTTRIFTNIITVGGTMSASGGQWTLGGSGVVLNNVSGYNFSSTSTSFGAVDLTLFRDAANTLAQRNGTNAQTFRLYRTFTDASNYERHTHSWSGDFLNIANEAAGTGTLRSIAFSANGAASTPPVVWSGTWFTGGTSTTTKPHLLIEPAGTTSNNFSTAGTGFAVNAPPGFAGDLAWFGINGANRFGVNSAGDITNTGHLTAAATFAVRSNTGAVGMWSGADFGWASGGSVLGSSLTLDLRLFRDAANTLAQRNGTNPQVHRIYNTFTSATNFERARVEWVSNILRIGTEKGSGGGTARDMELQTDGTTRITLKADGAILFSGIPTTNPNVAGQLWNDGGTLKISA